MTKALLFSLAIFPIFLIGQETKKITEEHKNPLTKEIYYVLKSNKSIRQGNYQKTTGKNQTLIDGYYKNGIKDSVWTFYDYQGEVEQKYDYTKNEIISFKLDDKEKDKEFKIIKGRDTIKTKLDRPPLYIGGSLAMFTSVFKSITYPKQAKENSISGKVYVTFTIDSTGKTSNHRVTTGIGFGCDEEALRGVKEIPDNWFPGRLNGQVVNVEYILPIRFTLYDK